MSYSYTPRYRLLIARTDASFSRITSLRQVNSLQSCTATLTTDTTVGTLTATWADTDFTTFGSTPTRPTPMVMVQLQISNKQGQWGIAWTGLADSITRTVNFGDSKTYTLSASSPYKLFNITTQTAAASLGFSMDYAFGIKGTALLAYAAKQCNFPGPLALLPAATGWAYNPAINGPGQKGTVDYRADVGVDTFGAMSASMFLSPAQQTYSSILQGLVADTEIEFFFNEFGQLIWRPLAYLNTPPQPIVIQKDTILNHAFTETDQGVLTTIYVRYYMVQAEYNQGVWNAPSAMAQALGPRVMVFYAPWIYTKQSADNLAAALGLRYSGNMHTAQTTVVADPTITVGTTIRLPKFPDLAPIDAVTKRPPTALRVQTTPWYYYYVYGITYNLTIGDSFTMDLDLRYGRDETLQFPYLNYSPYLQDHAGTGYSYGGVSVSGLGNKLTIPQYDLDPAHNSRITTPFAVSVDPSLDAQTMEVDPRLLPPGTQVMVKDKNGRAVGEFTTVAAPAGSAGGYQVILPSGTGTKAGSQVFLTVDIPGIIADSYGGTLTNDQGSYTNSQGGLVSGAAIVGDHVSQLHGTTRNYYCGPASVVRYLRNRTRRGLLGMPLSGDKWQQILQVVAACPNIDQVGSTFNQLGSFISTYGAGPHGEGGTGITPIYASSWAQVQAWNGEALVTVDKQPSPRSWPPRFFPAIGSVHHIILWMKDLTPGNLFDDPLAYGPNGVQQDCTYDLGSVQAGFLGALLLP